jgi:chorismate mutase
MGKVCGAHLTGPAERSSHPTDRIDGRKGFSMATDLTALRQIIDGIDDRILDLLADRIAVAERVAAHKRATGIAVRLPDRIEAVKARCAERGAARGLDPAYIRALWTVIIEETCRLEERLIGEATA